MKSKRAINGNLRKIFRKKSKNTRKSRKNILQIAGGKEELLAQMRTLETELYRLREIDRTNPHDGNDMRIQMVLNKIKDINIALKEYLTPAEKEAERLENERIRQRNLEVSRKRDEILAEMGRAYETRVSAEEQATQLRTQRIRNEQNQKINQWERENKSNLSDKKWVRAQLDEVVRRESDYTHEGQVIGSNLAAGINVELFIQLLRKYL
jgi:hypothetical protein